MAAKKSRHVRRFWNAAVARRREADILLDAGKTVGAVYLAGYAVECGLKALILAHHPEHRQPGVIAGFRGAQAHDYVWLRRQLLAAGGAAGDDGRAGQAKTGSVSAFTLAGR